MVNIKHFFMASSGAVLITTGLNVNPSLAVDLKTWTLKFFDATNQLVGTGVFSYDRDQRYFVQTNTYSDEWYYENGYYDEETGEIITLPTEGFYVNTLLNNFSATIALFPEDYYDESDGEPISITWTLNNFSTPFYSISPWWYDPSASVRFGNEWYDRFDWYETEYVIDSGWQFGGRYEVNNYLTMNLVGPPSNNVFQGNWSAYSYDYDYPVSSYGGTWTARIPEPLTLLGTATAIGFGMIFKTKASK